MSEKGALLGAIGAGLALGFIAGFLWGSETRSALGDATRTRFAGGVLTVEVDAAGAAQTGLRNLIG